MHDAQLQRYTAMVIVEVTTISPGQSFLEILVEESTGQ